MSDIDVSARAGAAARPSWYQLAPEEVATRLDVDPARGLSALEVDRRRQQYGSNVLAAKKAESGLQAFLRQYQDLMQIILVGAAIVNQVVTGEAGTTIVLLGLTVFNAVLGLRQEAKAEASLAALEKMLKDIARVRRDGAAVEIDAAELVPGDIVLFEAGNRVPADGRLIVAATLEIEEAALTGESAPVLKDLASIDGDDVGLGDRICLAFMNTSVTRGRGEMIVTGTGMSTEIGNIATLLNQTEAEKTPLQKQLDRLTQVIVGIAGIAFVAMVLLGIRERPALRRGVPRRRRPGHLRHPDRPAGRRHHAVLDGHAGAGRAQRHRQAAAVGGDARLGVGHLLGQDRHAHPEQDDRTGAGGARPQPVHDQRRGLRHHRRDHATTGGLSFDLDDALLPMALCADARLDDAGDLIGDPTEGALIVLAAKGGIDLDGARARYPRVAEVPFDSEYKFMATFHRMTDRSGREVVRVLREGRARRPHRPGEHLLVARRRGPRHRLRPAGRRARRERAHGRVRRAGDGGGPARLRPVASSTPTAT